MKYFSYVAIIGFSLAILPLFIHSEPIVYQAKASSTKLFKNVVEKEEDVKKCSCITGAREYGVDIPYNTNAIDLESNGTPIVGGLVLLEYYNSEIDEWIYHVAVNVELGADLLIYEENFDNPEGECRQGYRNIAWDDTAIRGFWTNQENDAVDNLALHL